MGMQRLNINKQLLLQLTLRLIGAQIPFLPQQTNDSLGNKIGHPVFTEGNESFKAHEIIYNFKSKKCRVKQITTKEGEGYILGKVVKKTEDDVFYLKKGDYTTCDAEKPHYSIRANRIKIIPGKKIITGPAYLTFFNIPTPINFSIWVFSK